MRVSRTAPGTPFPSRATRFAAVSRCIAEAEMHSTAQAPGIAALTAAGYDTTEAVQRLWHTMDALLDLR